MANKKQQNLDNLTQEELYEIAGELLSELDTLKKSVEWWEKQVMNCKERDDNLQSSPWYEGKDKEQENLMNEILLLEKRSEMEIKNLKKIESELMPILERLK